MVSSGLLGSLANARDDRMLWGIPGGGGERGGAPPAHLLFFIKVQNSVFDLKLAVFDLSLKVTYLEIIRFDFNTYHDGFMKTNQYYSCKMQQNTSIYLFLVKKVTIFGKTI